MGLFSYHVKLNWIGNGVSVGTVVGVAGGLVGAGVEDGGISVGNSVGVAVGSGGEVGLFWMMTVPRRYYLLAHAYKHQANRLQNPLLTLSYSSGNPKFSV